MSSHANASNNTSQGAGGGGGYPSTWPFNAAGFNAAAAVGTNAAHTSPTTSNSSSSGISRPLLSSGSGTMFPTSGSSGNGRYAARTGNPYETSLVRRRNQISSAAASSRDRRTQNGQSQGGDPERKRVVVARKIRCSGDDGNGGSCTNCKNANEPQCLFMRVQAGSLAEMRKKEHEKRMAAAAAVNTFSYDLDACRQYQSRGAASMGPNMSVSAPPAHSTVYGSSTSAFGGPSNVMYNWAPSGSGGGYGDGSGHGAGAHGNGGASMGYGMPYNSMSYHGMPSPEASYLGENDLLDRPTTATMADAGAFALQSLSQGLTSGSSSHGHLYGHGHGRGTMATSTPRSLPGPPTVLGSSRGVPPSSVFSASRAPQQYPSPATTPITSGVSPVWTGYEQSPYGTAAMPTSMAAQSLERLPDLYTATPPPPTENAASGHPGAGGSQHGDDEGLNGSDGSSNGGNGHNQAQQQHNHFEYSYGDSGGQSEGNGEEHSGGGGVDMVNNHTAASGTY
ncbi:Fungal transcriptional regulatory protein [Beauveria brongniartii RCEF 3172]|uniref:Fungal transcriptional regulatory protein n=1 Tax=Beauveria brongniartii RCEF 3172 TaxID=1081107 RepID=A0A162KGT0_9HYPO|nr:Fungal transcriptional regulatory protein [Beauveria brongniartii RCEF 3172]